jgi:hypothetical protein
MAGKKKVLEHHSGLRPSEKELPEWLPVRSVTKIPLDVVNVFFIPMSFLICEKMFMEIITNNV